MWQIIAEEVAQQLAQPVSFIKTTPVSGGDINQSYLATDQNRQAYFIKVNQAAFYDAFLAEAHALKKIARTKTIKVPDIIACSRSKTFSFLVLEALELTQPKQTAWRLAGTQLAKLHKADVQAKYGFDDDNFIGHTGQKNQWSSNWSNFFSEQRIGAQLELLAEKGILFGDIDDIVALVHGLLKPHKPEACLLHGDLWSGNISACADTPVIYDPASYYGDREIDIAMSQLFARFPDDFYQAYQAAWPLPKDAADRQHIYNLYHILNHANMFAGGYIDQARHAIKFLSQH
ncbi:fructosamine kinase family protein [Gayadomonas joobiniege]|uniref:fructosamine kinase family protein n=1 Tax=Gayadomonas joobiniege TaxID=1234606 RepID=UPI00035F293A|nr:fructosamine kinase family protein [Gayadomonas joobiniege]